MSSKNYGPTSDSTRSEATHDSKENITQKGQEKQGVSGADIARNAGASLCSGYGQWHSENHPLRPRPYTTISLSEIERMVQQPPSTEKELAQWVIFSTLPSRVHSEQRENGRFYALWADIDKPGSLSLSDIADLLDGFLPSYIAYTTKGATQDRQKARIIIFLASPVAGAVFVLLQKILNDKLQAAGITPDRATERAGQVCYLPNRGEFYRHIIVDGQPLDSSAWAADVAKEQQRIETEKQALRERREQAKAKAAKRIVNGQESPIDSFNQAFDLPMMLDSFGYIPSGRKWLSPNSSSGVPGVIITADGQKWMSAHGSDAQIGTPTSNGTMGDAFDLFAFYQHGGDRDSALRAAAALMGRAAA